MSAHAWQRRRTKRQHWTREQWDAHWERKHRRDWSWAQGKGRLARFWLGQP